MYIESLLRYGVNMFWDSLLCDRWTLPYAIVALSLSLSLILDSFTYDPWLVYISMILAQGIYSERKNGVIHVWHIPLTFMNFYIVGSSVVMI